jgi:uncharacterized protein
MTDYPVPILSLLETRVLGVMVEKQLTTPDNYPLTLNALTAGCNQKTSRDPVMNVAETEVQEVLDELKGKNLVIQTWGASRRVVRHGHNLPKILNTDTGTTALMVALMLRGPQTPGELRIACDRLHEFADLSSVEAYLEEMAARPSGALVVRLPKQPGAREHRWAHLLNGPVDIALVMAVDERGETGKSRLSTLEEEVAQLRSDLADLRMMVEEALTKP